MHYSFNNRPKLTVHVGLFEGCDQWNIEYIPTTGEAHAGKCSLLAKRKAKSFIFTLLCDSREGFLIRKAEA